MPRRDDPVGTLRAAFESSTRAFLAMGAGAVAFGLLLTLTGVADDLYLFGLIPVNGFLVVAGVLVLIATLARAAEFKALDFQLTDACVFSRGTEIPWDEIREIYRGGTVYLAQGVVRSGEDRFLRVVGQGEDEIEFELKFLGRLSKEAASAHDAIVETLVLKTVERHREELDARLAAGERVCFGDELWIGRDGVALDRYDPEPIPLDRVVGLECDNGVLKLRYQNARQRVRTRRLGELRETANVHLLDWALRPVEPAKAEAEAATATATEAAHATEESVRAEAPR